MPITSQGFPPETLHFLRELRSNNTKEWFDAHREDYDRYYVAPAKEFVVATGRLLSSWRPRIQAQPRILGSIFRITKDTRRTHVDGPYKDHIDFWFWEGERKAAGSAYFMRLSPDFVGIGGGKHTFTPDQRSRFRTAIDDDTTGADLLRIVERIEDQGYTISGGPRTNAPNANAQAGRRSQLQRHRSMFVHHDEPNDVATNGRALFTACERVWDDLTPMHEWLVDNVQ